MRYDNAGDLTSEGQSYQYDATGQQVSATGGAANVAMAYGGVVACSVHCMNFHFNPDQFPPMARYFLKRLACISDSGQSKGGESPHPSRRLPTHNLRRADALEE